MAKRSSRKRQKSSLAKRKPEEVDRVSSLPDELLCHILSFLPTKESVATSVLSTRWKSLWTLVCALDFNDNNPSFSKNNFAEVVNDVLVQRKAKCMKRLCLSGYNKLCSPHIVMSLVSLATGQTVEELDLSYIYVETTLPCSLFTCQTLSFLKLDGRIKLDLPSSVHLPFLRILHLCLLCFADDESIMRLLSGCPVLEELYYEELKFNRTTSFGIRVPSLKRLHVTSKDERLQVNTPNLRYLLLEDTTVIDYVVETLEDLEEAHLDIFFDHEDEKENIPNLFNGIHKTRFMCLSFCVTEVLIYACLEFPVFHNLVHLQLYLDTLDSYFVVELLLEKCPKLEVLDIQKVHENFHNEIEWTEPTTAVPSCLSSHLTTFKFREYGGTPEELEVVGYFLKSGKVLKTTTIHFASWLEEKKLVRVVGQLCALPRASKDCRTDYQMLDEHLL